MLKPDTVVIEAKNSTRLIFAGTPEFAAIHLQALLNAGIRPVAVYTQPDRPSGRGQQQQASAVKQLALTYDIPVEQPINFKSDEAQETLKAYAPDLMIVVAYGLLLPPIVLATPRLGCVNVHGSLLPRWRGAAPIQRAIQALDTETGVGLMQMEAGLDTGPVLAEARIAIAPTDTAASLHDKLAAAGANLLLEQLPKVLDQSLVAKTQSEQGVTYAKKLEKAEAMIDWSQSATQIDAQVRAFNPWPVAQTTVSEHTLRVWRSEPVNDSSSLRSAPRSLPGQILAQRNDRLLVACGEGVLAITEVQIAGGKRLSMKDMLNAKRELFAVGASLGAHISGTTP